MDTENPTELPIPAPSSRFAAIKYRMKMIMIIKYSQLELAGNLYYPVGILLGGSALLVALGIFLKLTRGHTE